MLDKVSVSDRRCVDDGIVSVDENTGAVSYDPAINDTDLCRIRVIFDDNNLRSSPVFSEFFVSVI